MLARRQFATLMTGSLALVAIPWSPLAKASTTISLLQETASLPATSLPTAKHFSELIGMTFNVAHIENSSLKPKPQRVHSPFKLQLATVNIPSNERQEQFILRFKMSEAGPFKDGIYQLSAGNSDLFLYLNSTTSEEQSEFVAAIINTEIYA